MKNTKQTQKAVHLGQGEGVGLLNPIQLLSVELYSYLLCMIAPSWDNVFYTGMISVFVNVFRALLHMFAGKITLPNWTFCLTFFKHS